MFKSVVNQLTKALFKYEQNFMKSFLKIDDFCMSNTFANSVTGLIKQNLMYVR